MAPWATAGTQLLSRPTMNNVCLPHPPPPPLPPPPALAHTDHLQRSWRLLNLIGLATPSMCDISVCSFISETFSNFLVQEMQNRSCSSQLGSLIFHSELWNMLFLIKHSPCLILKVFSIQSFLSLIFHYITIFLYLLKRKSSPMR